MEAPEGFYSLYSLGWLLMYFLYASQKERTSEFQFRKVVALSEVNGQMASVCIEITCTWSIIKNTPLQTTNQPNKASPPHLKLKPLLDQQTSCLFLQETKKQRLICTIGERPNIPLIFFQRR